MRWEVTKRFNEFLAPHFEQIKLVAIVEGFDKDSKRATLISMGEEITHFGAESLQVLTARQQSLLCYQ